MPEEVVITAANLTKVYKLYNSPVDRLKESLHPLRRQYHHDFYALNDVSFEIMKGESIGIIGKNGSGKSTLLKILTGVLTPTSGSVEVNGKVSALLELGAGFNPELSGIENVYFNGMLMGYTRDEMDEKLDVILSFADIGEFIYQPVKTYSSGMFVRLAFAVAINVDPDILIVDEAMSVGDIKFQRKCYGKIEQFSNLGKNILFVSHDVNSINMLCSKAILLDSGTIKMVGAPKKVTRAYQEMMLGKDIVRDRVDSFDNDRENDESISDDTESGLQIRDTASSDEVKIKKIVEDKLLNWNGTKKAEIIDAGIWDKHGELVTTLTTGERYTIFARAIVYDDLDTIYFGYPIKDVKGLFLFGVNSGIQKIKIRQQKQGDLLESSVDVRMWLAPGEYFLTFGLGTVETNYDLLDDQILITVVGDCSQHPSSIVNLEPKVNVRNLTL